MTRAQGDVSRNWIKTINACDVSSAEQHLDLFNHHTVTLSLVLLPTYLLLWSQLGNTEELLRSSTHYLEERECWRKVQMIFVFSPGMSLPSNPRSAAAMTSVWYSAMIVTTSEDQLERWRVLYLRSMEMDLYRKVPGLPLCNIPQFDHSFISSWHHETLSHIFLLFNVLKNKCTCAEHQLKWENIENLNSRPAKLEAQILFTCMLINCEKNIKDCLPLISIRAIS